MYSSLPVCCKTLLYWRTEWKACHFYLVMKTMQICTLFCNGNATAVVEEYDRWFLRWRTLDRHEICIAHHQLRERGTFPTVSSPAEHAVRQNVDDQKNITGMVHCSLHISTWRTATCLTVLHTTVWLTLNLGGRSLSIPSVANSAHEPGDGDRQLEYCYWLVHTPTFSVMSYWPVRLSSPMMRQTIQKLTFMVGC
jgi:hypothetical protein